MHTEQTETFKHSDVKKKKKRENPAGASSASRTQTISLHRLPLFAAQPEPVFNYGRDGEWLQPEEERQEALVILLEWV